MKKCIRCGMALPYDSQYCTSCGTDQRIDFKTQLTQHEQNDTFLKVLCILTIVWACFSLISVPVSMIRLSGLGGGSVYMMLGLTLVIAAAKLTGAIFMLQKKLTGLYIYTVAASVSILLSIANALGLGDSYSHNLYADAFVIFVSTIPVIITLAFLIMYWLKVNRRLLS